MNSSPNNFSSVPQGNSHMKKFIFIVILFIVLSGVWIKGLQWYMAKKIETKVDQTLEEASDQQMRIQRQVEEEIKRAREAGN